MPDVAPDFALDVAPDFVADFVIEGMPLPTTLDGEAGALFEAVVEIHNAVEVAGPDGRDGRRRWRRGGGQK